MRRTHTNTTQSWMPRGCQGQDPSWVRPTISGSEIPAMAAVTKEEASPVLWEEAQVLRRFLSFSHQSSKRVI